MSNTSQSPFTWRIDSSRDWPPRGRPQAPFGPTIIDILRSCPLRACFEYSKGYERRMAYAGRVGTAFHKTLQSLTEQPIASEQPSEVIDEAYRRFRHELAIQEAQKSRRPREQRLPRHEDRIHRALESAATEALRLTKQLASIENMDHKKDEIVLIPNTHPTLIEETSPGHIFAEVSVQSQDGLLAGRVDYAERLLSGTRLLDYKSALRDDLPERYERQLQLYALLWYETFGEWPQEAQVVYPFTGAIHRVSITPETCQQVGDDAREIIKRVHDGLPPEQLAIPGNICTVCEFRPWCKPFWMWQARQPNHSAALQNAVFGFEGKIISVELKASHWKVMVKWRDAEIRIVAPEERFLQLAQAQAGDHIRALDMKLQGQRYRPQALITESSELFLVE